MFKLFSLFSFSSSFSFAWKCQNIGNYMHCALFNNSLNLFNACCIRLWRARGCMNCVNFFQIHSVKVNIRITSRFLSRVDKLIPALHLNLYSIVDFRLVQRAPRPFSNLRIESSLAEHTCQNRSFTKPLAAEKPVRHCLSCFHLLSIEMEDPVGQIMGQQKILRKMK